MLHQEGIDSLQDSIVPGVVPPLLQSIGTGVEDMEQSLALTTKFPGW